MGVFGLFVARTMGASGEMKYLFVGVVCVLFYEFDNLRQWKITTKLNLRA